MKRIITTSLYIIPLLFCACNDHIYAPALYKSDIAYQYKPMSSDSVKNANYVSGAISIGRGVNQQDNVLIGHASFSRANTFQNFNVAYGGYGFFGNYQNTSIPNYQPGYFTNKYLSGIGIRGSANVYTPSGRTDLRLLGIEASYSKEFGAYTGFREYAQSLPGFYTNANTGLLTAGLTSEIIWHNQRDLNTQYGYRLFIGSVFGNQNLYNSNDPNGYSPYNDNSDFCISGAFFVNVTRVHFVVEYQNFSTVTLGFGHRL